MSCLPETIPRAVWSLVLVACLSAAGSGASAAPFEYRLDLPADRMLSYRIEFEVPQPGSFRIEADWSPARVLVLRLDRPGRPSERRSGPPPSL